MILLSHPFGNANVRQAARALIEGNLLAEFWTGVAWNPDNPINRYLPKNIRALLGRRSFPSEVRPFLRQAGVYEISRLLAQKLGIPVNRDHGFLSPNWIHESMDRSVAERIRTIPNLTGVYAYDHGALASFKTAKELQIYCIYDLPIPSWHVHKSILAEEAERFPEWNRANVFATAIEETYSRKDEELQLADVVITASSFTARTIASDVNLKAPVVVIPYGAPEVNSNWSGRTAQKQLRILFAGSLGLRKGLPYLLQAVKTLDKMVSLTLIGSAPTADIKPLHTALRRYRWIPTLDQASLFQEMQRHDVFVFPSLFEGFGLVILEAMSQGLPVITTPNTGGPDVITDGKDGFIVPIRSIEALIEKITLLKENPEMLSEMKQEAIKTAAGWSWNLYRQRLVDHVRNVLDQ